MRGFELGLRFDRTTEERLPRTFGVFVLGELAFAVDPVVSVVSVASVTFRTTAAVLAVTDWSALPFCPPRRTTAAPTMTSAPTTPATSSPVRRG